MDFKNLTDLLTNFSDENTCIKHLTNQRWTNGIPVCPYCFYEGAYIIEKGKRFKCKNKECFKKYSVRVGTIFEDSKISLRVWFAAMYLATSHKKGISSIQLSRDLGITQKTAWFVLHRIREMLKDKAPEKLRNHVEIDEVYIGGKEKNKHRSKRTEGAQGRSTKSKEPLLGILQRNKKIIVKHVLNTSANIIQPIMVDNVELGSTIHTDEYGAYNGLNNLYNHNVVKHGSGEYVKGDSHTNTIEGFWSLFKRGYIGIYHYMSPKHLHRYCDEFSYRYNSRKEFDNDRFNQVLTHTEGRLTYKRLIKKSTDK